jgi:hypothetical protein
MIDLIASLWLAIVFAQDMEVLVKMRETRVSRE